MKSDEILVSAANGNADALAFLRAFAMRAHWVDDLADGMRPTPAEPLGTDRPSPLQLAWSETEWLTVLATNTFFLNHRAQLVPVMILALAAWADSHKVPPSAMAVLKEQWQEVVWLVAWITGGWAGMRKTCLREFEVEIPIVNGIARDGDPPRLKCDWCGLLFGHPAIMHSDPLIVICSKECLSHYRASPKGRV